MRVVVVGVGGIGGTVLGGLAAFGPKHLALTGLTTNQAVVASVAARGLKLTGVDGDAQPSARVVSRLDDSARFDLVFLATQPPQLVDAARQIAPHLAPGARVVCFQNGLPEERVAEVVGRASVVGGIVGWGASMPEPGVFERTSGGGFSIGALDPNTQVDDIATLLEPIGPVKQTTNLLGARWSKLALNAAISTLGTIGGDRLGALMPYTFVRRLALEIFTETVAVTDALDIELEKVGGTLDLPWIALTEAERRGGLRPSLAAKHALLLAVGARYRRLRSSMLAAIERGRPPAVDFLNGEIVRRGQSLGIPTPVNHEAQRLVHAIAAGDAVSGVDTLRQLAAVGVP